MPITGIFWPERRRVDLHVLRGKSTPDFSDTHLQFQQTNGSTTPARSYLNNADDVTLEFKPLFKGVSHVVNGSKIFSGHGIHVNTETGLVKVDAAAPAIPKRNFIMEFVVTNKSDGKKFTGAIRVHVHGSVHEAWLTPSTLTVRPTEATRPHQTWYRFSVRVQFDDGVVADLSEIDGITWGPASNVIDWNGRLIIAPGDNVGDIIDITATLPPEFGSATAEGKMRVAAEWKPEATTTTASVVVGGGWPGTINPDVVPNFLFLGDGFAPGDEGLFDQLVNSIVHRLKTNRLTRPFDILATSMNFWKAFVPSDNRGISVRCEIYPYERDGKLGGWMVPNPEKPPDNGDWDLEHLIYAVGLPVNIDDLTNTSRKNKDIRHDWAQLVDPDPSPHVSNALITRWRLLARRSLLEECDSVFHLAYGKPPMVSGKSNNSLIDFHKGEDLFHPNRMNRDKLDKLLRTIRDANGTSLGHIWARSGDTRPPNYDYVFLICSCCGVAGRNHDEYITMNVENRDELDSIKQADGKNAFEWDHVNISSKVSNVLGAVAAHEIGHSFGLGDEYAKLEETFLGSAADLESYYGNLQDHEDVLDDNGQIHGDQIKWNWHRIKNAGVVSRIITSTPGGEWKIPLIKGHGGRFSQGDTVFLRKRNYPKPLGKLKKDVSDPDLSQPLQVLQVGELPAVVKPPPLPPLPAADFVLVSGVITPDEDFGEGDVLYVPVPAPESVRSASYPYAEMVAKNIKDFITNNHRPLTAVPCQRDYRGEQDPELPGVDLPFCFSHKTRIVGLYAGGRQYHCGIYHPTGNCIMRDSENTHSREFCAVCRYVIVDIIDPSKHATIDDDYNDIYPQA